MGALKLALFREEDGVRVLLTPELRLDCSSSKSGKEEGAMYSGHDTEEVSDNVITHVAGDTAGALGGSNWLGLVVLLTA